MIHYDLRCHEGHGFDGWFRDSAAFEAQAARGLVECPQCGDARVARAMMAPAVVSRGRPAPAEPAPAPGPSSGPSSGPAPGAAVVPAPAPAMMEPQAAVAAAKLPAQAVALLQRLRAEVESRCDYVGPDFAEQARRIHRGERDARGIYGEATPEEAEALTDEGIEVNRIPWLPRADG